MDPSIRPQEWLHFLRQEYLDSFVREGGSAIKFVVPLDEQAGPTLFDDVVACASSLGYLVAVVSAGECKVHMIDHLFFKIAEQISWEDLSERVILKLAEEEGYEPPSDGPASLLQRMAVRNEIDPEFLNMGLRRRIANKVFRHRKLSKDFRIAMSQICLARLTGGPEGETTIQVLSDWLTGRNRAVSAVKPYQIFTRINRSNARHFIESVPRWVRFAGYTGILILLDIARISVARNPRDEQLYYTKAAVLDAYEVLRQFIDATDRLKGCVITVVPDAAFLDDDPLGRGIGAYEALKFRVYDEVRDRALVNPMASLLRLSSSGGI